MPLPPEGVVIDPSRVPSPPHHPIKRTSTVSDLLSRPVLLIGAGRSGSTLFGRILNAHPRIHYLGETSFLIARLWRETWENRFWFNFRLHVSAQPRSSREGYPTVDAETLARERERVAASIRRCFADIMRVRSDIDAWGYKEIWNGNDAVARIPWDCYDTVFPEAIWVHLVRNPFDFLKSLAQWNNYPLTPDFISHEMNHWMEMLYWNRQRASRPVFFEIRYEHLKANPKDTLTPILQAAGVDWHEQCLEALTRRDMTSAAPSPFPRLAPIRRIHLKEILAQVDNLLPCLEEMGYELPVTFPVEAADAAAMASLPDAVDLRASTGVRCVMLGRGSGAR